MSASVRVWAYRSCDTCRKAIKWLEARDIQATILPIVDTPPDRATLEALWRRSGLPLKRFFNTAGQSYRAGGWKDRIGTISESDALDALASDGKLIKRPLVDTGAGTLVGFKLPEWEAAFGANDA